MLIRYFLVPTMTSSVSDCEYEMVVCRYGIYPLTAYGGWLGYGRAPSPAERALPAEPATDPPRADLESRRVVNMMCSLKPHPHPHHHQHQHQLQHDAPQPDLLVSTSSLLTNNSILFRITSHPRMAQWQSAR